jgi:hypothetical protein
MNAVMVFDKLNLVTQKLKAIEILGLMLDKGLVQLKADKVEKATE